MSNSDYEFEGESGTWLVPNDCLARLKEFVVGNRIAEGAYGKVFEFCKSKSSCDKIIKLVPLKDVTGFNREAKITKLASDLGISPHLESAFTCPDVFEISSDESIVPMGFLVQDRWTMTVLDFLFETERVSLPPGVKQRLKNKILKMHQAGIAHNDLHQGNVILKAERNDKGQLVLKDVAVIDFDAAVLRDENPVLFDQIVKSELLAVDEM